MSPAARRTVTYWLLLLLPTLAVGGAAILLLRKEQARLAAQRELVGEARRTAATARAGLIVENTELLIGDIQTALLDSLAQMPVAGLDEALNRWEKENPLVRKAWRSTLAGRLVHPASTDSDEESRAFRRRFAPLLERNPPWTQPAKDASNALAKKEAPSSLGAARNEEAEAVRQQAYVNVEKVQNARLDAKRASSSRKVAADEVASYSVPAAPSVAGIANAAPQMKAKELERDLADLVASDRRGWLPLNTEGRTHLLGWVERPSAGEVRGVEVEFTALIARLGGTLPDETRSDEGYALRDDRGRIMLQTGWVPHEVGAAVVALPLSQAMLPGWEVVAYLAAPARDATSQSGFLFVGILLVAILVAAILAGGSLLLWQARRSEAEAAQKTSFVANVSHEFKTPLTTIRLYTELLEQGRVGDEAKRRDYLVTIGRETQRLARLVGNALDFSRLEQGKRNYARDSVELRGELTRLLDTHAPRLEEAGLALRRAFAEPPLTLTTDRDALDQIVLNLLDNAAKYAAEGGEVEVGLAPRAGGGASITVSDRGPGVPSAHRERIFEKFHRVDESLTAEKGGTGLGLSIARQLARGLGGELHYADRPGGGAMFTLELP